MSGTQSETSPLRVLHAPELVGGNAGRLTLAEREIGLQSHCVSFWRHPFGYPCDEVLWDSYDSIVTNELKRFRLLWRALREFDVIHFNFGMSILPKRLDDAIRPASRARGLWRAGYNLYASLLEFRDLALLKKAGKVIFVTYQGDDARQGAYCGSHFSISPVGEVDASYYTPQSDARKQDEIRKFDRYADEIFAVNPDLLHVLPKRARFIPYAHIDLRDWHPVPPAANARPLVVHAPSHQGVKGTRFVLDAVSRLKAEGVEFDFALVESMQNADARRIYEKADLLIDQLLVGWYGGLTVEFMALGKPVICYIREEDTQFLDPEMRSQLPIIRAEPATIHGVLKQCLTTDRARLAEIGAQGRKFVERWHDPLKTAEFLKAQYLSALRRSGSACGTGRNCAHAAKRPTIARPGMKHLLILSLSDLEKDPRVNRQIRLLAKNCRVTAAGFADPAVDGVEFIHIPYSPRSSPERVRAVALLKLGQFERFYWTSNTIRHALAALDSEPFDLILANDLSALPLACKLRSKHGVLYDAHEYSPREYEESLSWRFLFRSYNDYLCRTYIPKAAGMLTVCQSIADAYKMNYGADAKVMTNSSPYHELAPSPTQAGTVRMIHHGGATPSRNIESMIEIMDYLDERFHLDLMLVASDPRYYERLGKVAQRHPRVRMVPAMPMRELPVRLNKYDVGLYLLPPNSFNNRYALPNKFFEFIQARLAVAIGPSPEMARLVRQYGCGIVSEDFTPRGLADSLRKLDADEIDHFKQRSHLAARELSFDKDAEVLLTTINGLTGNR